MEAKAKWEATVAKLENIQNQTQELVEAREVVYDKLVSTSIGAFASAGGNATAGRYVDSTWSM